MRYGIITNNISHGRHLWRRVDVSGDGDRQQLRHGLEKALDGRTDDSPAPLPANPCASRRGSGYINTKTKKLRSKERERMRRDDTAFPRQKAERLTVSGHRQVVGAALVRPGGRGRRGTLLQAGFLVFLRAVRISVPLFVFLFFFIFILVPVLALVRLPLCPVALAPLRRAAALGRRGLPRPRASPRRGRQRLRGLARGRGSGGGGGRGREGEELLEVTVYRDEHVSRKHVEGLESHRLGAPALPWSSRERERYTK